MSFFQKISTFLVDCFSRTSYLWTTIPRKEIRLTFVIHQVVHEMRIKAHVGRVWLLWLQIASFHILFFLFACGKAVDFFYHCIDLNCIFNVRHNIAYFAFTLTEFNMNNHSFNSLYTHIDFINQQEWLAVFVKCAVFVEPTLHIV